MEHPNNNNQDDGGDNHGRRPVPAALDELSKPQITSGSLRIQPGYGPYFTNINQHRSSDHELGPNFTQNNLMSNNNLFHENPSSSNFAESSRQRRRESSEGPMGKDRKTCNCKKSGCLTLYCACFANKRYCSANCKCQDCENPVENEHVVNAAQKKLLQINPTAFDPKIIGDEHKKGCTCKKSGCEKKYCECNAHNVKCTSKCGCINCKNPFGARDYGEITVPGEMNTQAGHDNMAANVPVGLPPLLRQQPVQVPMRWPNYSYGSMGNSENQLTGQPQRFVSNSYHPSINNRIDTSAMMMQGWQGYPNLPDSRFNNGCGGGSSSSRSGALIINENNEPIHDTLPGDVDANAMLAEDSAPHSIFSDRTQ